MPTSNAARAARLGAREAPRRARAARPARSRRQDPDGLERPHDPRARDRRAPARASPRCVDAALAADRFPARAMLAGRPALRRLEGRAPRASPPTSTTTPSCSTRCSSCCSRASGPRTSTSPARLADALLAQFEDRERGGFWFTAEGAGPAALRAQGLRRRRHGRPATASRPRRSRGSAGSPGRRAISTRPKRTIRGGFASLARAPRGARRDADRARRVPRAGRDRRDPRATARNSRPGRRRSRAAMRRGAW